MNVALTCPCGATTTYSGSDIYGKFHVEKWHAEHRECQPVALPEVRTLRALPGPRLAGWRR